MNAARIVVDSDLCSGHGRCYSLHPELFDVDDSGYPIIRNAVISAEQVSDAQDAAENCPEAAIRVTTVTIDQEQTVATTDEPAT